MTEAEKSKKFREKHKELQGTRGYQKSLDLHNFEIGAAIGKLSDAKKRTINYVVESMFKNTDVGNALYNLMVYAHFNDIDLREELNKVRKIKNE